MNRLDELTIGDLRRSFTRYRPFVAVVLGIFLIAVVLPGTRDAADDDLSDTGNASRSGSLTTGTGGVTVDGETADTVLAADGSTVSGGGATGRTGGGVTSGRLAGGTGGATASVAPALSSGGGADPLDAPDCDRAKGRIMVPDLQAPNCVPLWSGDNGGATYQGVERDKIRIAIYIAEENDQSDAILADAGYQDDTDEQEDNANRQKIIEAYEAHFETYGRHVEFQLLKGSGPPNDDAAAKADAIRAATEMKVFAVISAPGATNAFTDELAARGVLCFCTVSQPIENYLRWAPYVWSILMASSQGYVHRAEYACRLKGGKAEHAGSPELQIQDRKLGLIYYETADQAYKVGADFFEQELARICGWKLTDRIANVYNVAQSAENAKVQISRMKDKGVTTIAFAGHPFTPIFLTKEATNQQYFPEWMITGSALTDTTFFARTYAPEQWGNAFGVSFLVARVDPDYTATEPNIVEWHHGQELTSEPNLTALGQFFTGIHLAGPHLSPETFRDGMFSFKPTGGHLTDYAVSYGRGVWPWEDYLALDDTTEIWWDPNARGPDELEAEGVGMYHYVDGGKRYMPGQWPTTPPKVFVTDGSVMLYPERPEGDRPPKYEHKDHHRGG